MATPLSILNLINGGWRTVLSIVGISVATVLIFMQLGFLGAVTDTAVVFYDRMKFDLLISSPDYYYFCDPGKFPQSELALVQAVDSVESVQPLHIGLGSWNYADQNVQRGVLILGLDTDGTTFADPEVVSKKDLFAPERSVLIDRSSLPIFLGESNKDPFGDQHIGLQVELNGQAHRIAGHFELGTGLAADGAVLMNQATFRKITPGYSDNDTSLGLVQLKQGTDVRQARQQILNAISHSQSDQGHIQHVDVLTRDQAQARETNYWMAGTPVGFIFLTGVVVAFLVGAIIVYIVLSADISKQIGEYATLKAMGYRNSFLFGTVMEQAFILAVVSYLLALGISLLLYQLVGTAANLPINMTVTRQILVFFSSLVMSFLSALLAMRKLRQADPAELF